MVQTKHLFIGNRMFSKIARFLSYWLGHSITFCLASLMVLIWLAFGPYFNYSDSWELLINTLTTIITFMMVFLLQNTQNRDTTAIQLKLDEIIRSIQGSHNELVKIEEVSDDELKEILKRYEELATQIKCKIKNGKEVTGCPDINISKNNNS